MQQLTVPPELEHVEDAARDFAQAAVDAYKARINEQVQALVLSGDKVAADLHRTRDQARKLSASLHNAHNARDDIRLRAKSVGTLKTHGQQYVNGMLAAANILARALGERRS